MIDVVGAVGVIFPSGGFGDAEGLVDGGGEVFRRLRGEDGVGTEGIGGSDDASPLNASSGEEDGLGGSPVIASGEGVVFAEV